MNKSPNKYFIKVLSVLLHHANRLGKDIEFYSVKAKILLRYGKKLGYDVQLFSGKDCFSCYGTGKFESWSDGDSDDCPRCDGTGYWRSPSYVILDKYQFGDYTFHTPRNQMIIGFPTDDILSAALSTIHTYIVHRAPEKYAGLCKLLLFLLYDRKTFWQRIISRWLRDPGYVTWEMYKPKNFFLNMRHVIVWSFKTRGCRIPLFESLKEQRMSEKNYKRLASYVSQESGSDDLPF